jgi:glucose-6-phosphate dehydrogenase assembly protein OpcA
VPRTFARLGAVMHHHPSRAIVLRMSPGVEPSANVFAECWLPSGGQSQICSEGVELNVDASHAAQVVLPLLVADLPVVLWYYGSFHRHEKLLHLAQKVIVDSDSASGSIDAVRALRSHCRLVADLAWTRLTGWREALANTVACKKWSPSAITAVRIEHGPPSSGIEYFKRWIHHAIPSATVTLESKPGDPGLRAVTLSGEGPEVSLALSGGAIEVRAGERCARSPLPLASDEALMREELSILGPDPVFDAVLP